MPKRSRFDQLDQAVQALLAQPDSLLPTAEAEVAPLVSLAAALRDLPREEFKQRLQSDLERRSSVATQPMPEPVNYIREGFHTITPYVIVQGAAEFLDFLKAAFGARERLRVPRPGTDLVMHAEVDIGGYIIELADSIEQYPPAARGTSPLRQRRRRHLRPRGRGRRLFDFCSCGPGLRRPRSLREG